MMKTEMDLFFQTLAPKVDALDLALHGVESGHSSAGTRIRYVAKTLRESARVCGFADICDAARTAEDSAADDLPMHTRTLIGTLRARVADHGASSFRMLVIGRDQASNGQLVTDLAEDGLDARAVTNVSEAHAALRENEVSAIILDVRDFDPPWRGIIEQLRTDPLAGAPRILVVGADDRAALDADDYLRDDDHCVGAVDTEMIKGWISTRIRLEDGNRRAAIRDTKTGLLSRESFGDLFDDYLGSKKEAESMTLVCFAIDDYAGIVAKYGHVRGEAVVQHVGLVLSASMRASDVLARWGVGEFVALLPVPDLTRGARAAEKVIRLLRKENMTVGDDEPHKVTLSAGVTLVGEGQALDQAVAQAERHVLEAQGSGGDRAVCSVPREGGVTKQVLLVRGDGATDAVISKLLANDGLEIETVGDTPSALSAMAATRYDLLLVGEHLRRGSGFDTIAAIRGVAAHSRVAIIMLLDGDSEDSKVRSLELGANDYIAKPWSVSVLLGEVRRALLRGTVREAATGEMRRALVISLESHALFSCASALTQLGGFRTYLANSAEDGLARFAEVRPDVVLLDCDTPGLTRVQVAGLARQATVLLISGGEGACNSFMCQGVRGVLDKPIRLRTLGNDMIRLLDLSEESKRPRDRSEHLNHEIQRILRSAPASIPDEASTG